MEKEDMLKKIMTKTKCSIKILCNKLTLNAEIYKTTHLISYKVKIGKTVKLISLTSVQSWGIQ